MSPRTGRPTTDPKTKSLRMRVSEQDLDMLKFCCEKLGKNQSDTIRCAIESLFIELSRTKK